MSVRAQGGRAGQDPVKGVSPLPGAFASSSSLGPAADSASPWGCIPGLEPGPQGGWDHDLVGSPAWPGVSLTPLLAEPYFLESREEGAAGLAGLDRDGGAGGQGRKRALVGGDCRGSTRGQGVATLSSPQTAALIAQAPEEEC